MGNGAGKLDVPHSLTANLVRGYFDVAFFADLAFVTYSLVLSAVTFPVFLRTENALTVQAVFFRLKSAVVNGFRFFYLSV